MNMVSRRRQRKIKISREIIKNNREEIDVKIRSKFFRSS
jgi:hypothetical protein